MILWTSKQISVIKLNENNELNKSVEIFGFNEKRIDTEPLEASHPWNASFGVENNSELHDGSEEDSKFQQDPTSTLKDSSEFALASAFSIPGAKNNQNRSKTPPIDARRKLVHEPNDPNQYHRPIGAKEDFYIEAPVMEPQREEEHSKQSHQPSQAKSSQRHEEIKYKEDAKKEIKIEEVEYGFMSSNNTSLPSPIAKTDNSKKQ